MSEEIISPWQSINGQTKYKNTSQRHQAKDYGDHYDPESCVKLQRISPPTYLPLPSPTIKSGEHKLIKATVRMIFLLSWNTFLLPQHLIRCHRPQSLSLTWHQDSRQSATGIVQIHRELLPPYSCLIDDAVSRPEASHPSTPRPAWVFAPSAGQITDCPSSHGNRLDSTVRRSEAPGVALGRRSSIKTRDLPSRRPCSSLLHPAILSGSAPRLPVGHGAGQRPFPRGPRIMGDSDLRTVVRPGQPFV